MEIDKSTQIEDNLENKLQVEITFPLEHFFRAEKAIKSYIKGRRKLKPDFDINYKITHQDNEIVKIVCSMKNFNTINSIIKNRNSLILRYRNSNENAKKVKPLIEYSSYRNL